MDKIPVKVTILIGRYENATNESMTSLALLEKFHFENPSLRALLLTGMET